MAGRMAWLFGDPVARRVLPPGGWSAGALGCLAAGVGSLSLERRLPRSLRLTPA